MVRMSMLRNYPVVLEERQIGLLHGIHFDQTRKWVCALVVSCGMHGKRMVSAQQVRMIADGFVLIDGLEKYRRSQQQTIWPFLRDTTGMLVGRATDYAIERKTMKVLAIEAVTGYWPTEIRNRVWVYEYNALKDTDDLIVPDVLRGRPSFSREEDGLCEYPR